MPLFGGLTLETTVVQSPKVPVATFGPVCSTMTPASQCSVASRRTTTKCRPTQLRCARPQPNCFGLSQNVCVNSGLRGVVVLNLSVVVRVFFRPQLPQSRMKGVEGEKNAGVGRYCRAAVFGNGPGGSVRRLTLTALPQSFSKPGTQQTIRTAQRSRKQACPLLQFTQ
jgi:hypothetical protein